jgi:nicotinate-nucleotide pyrophosphorylase (carboxylating)
MQHDFYQHRWTETVAEDCRALIRLAIREDLDRFCDWTSAALVPADALGRAAVVARETMVVAGLKAVALTTAEIDNQIECELVSADGEFVAPGTTLAILAGPARTMLTAERTLLNFLGRLCGVASTTREYVEAIAGCRAKIYDTRKTTPGWRRLEKYAVACGGGRNLRTGLFDAVLIKDNHLAFGATAGDAANAHGGAGRATRFTPAEAVRVARNYTRETMGESATRAADGPMIVEVEVDTLEQLADVLAAGPDIVLLDNMTPGQLAAAVQMRDAVSPGVELEASGGVNLQTVRAIAESGVDRISVGRLTHSAVSRDVALDWAAG